MTPTSSAWRNADTIVDGRLASLLAALDAEGLSMRAIADRLALDYSVHVSHTTVSTWLATLTATLTGDAA